MTGHATEPQHVDFPYGPDGTSWSALVTSAGLGEGRATVIAEPARDPRQAYPEQDELDIADFEIPAEGMSAQQRKRALNRLETYLVGKHETMVGFQGNQDMARYQQDLARFMEFHLNNVGDPFQQGNYKPNTKIVERAVLDHYASLWRAAWPYDAENPDSYWGYVLTMGSTEGNLYALASARDYLSGKKLITEPGDGGDQMVYVQAVPASEEPGNANRPVAFYSEDTHYSVIKAVRTLAIDTFAAVGRAEYPGQCPLGMDWPMEVPSRGGPDGTGEIDVDALEQLVTFFAERGHPVLLLLNFGTTFKGAYDNIEKVAARLIPVFERTGLLEREIEFEPGRTDRRRGFWVHVDGALGAGFMPFLRIAAAEDRGSDLALQLRREIKGKIPEFDFGLVVDGVDVVSSLVMSGHKWPGAPWPCGVFMTKNKFRVEPPSQPAYTGSPDTTFAGSRNGLSPLVLWNDLASKSIREHAAEAVRALRTTRYLESSLRELEDRLDREDRLPDGGLYVDRSPMALTVRFRKPADHVIEKWSLSCQPIRTGSGRIRHYAHVFAMSSVTEEKVDAFIEDLFAEGAFDRPHDVAEPQRRAGAQTFATDVRPLALVPVIGRGFQ
ncbi:pyridoxal-dependent decarboxylase [Kibdelosporangium persicum]|uniref:L-methionine decarboxylase n=1 Tax=Kibdelosporangium persicum TaxID=2698649 RepID=A0ABX2FDU0_9PSEU|nr:pyridoxal-dependent decarboxylase [Kibdelosporangium persicum]NRN69535.1 L-methionine decarboxylase [Kibdelosporangium persicum]